MPALLLKLLPYLAAIAVGAFGMHYLDGAHYNALDASFSKYKAQMAEAAVASQKAYTAALQAQIDDRTKVEQSNSESIQRLSDENKALTADRDHTVAMVRRLLNPPQASTPSGGAKLPQAGSGQGSAGTSGAAGNEQVVQLLADAHDECIKNANRLDALIAEIKPQL